MVGNLTNEEHKWILKQYWKTDKSECLREQWRRIFATPPRTILFILQTCQEIDTDKGFCARECISARSQLETCINNGGEQF